MIDMTSGTLIEVKVYQKYCKPEHFIVKYRGFGISQSILDQLEENNVKYVRIIYEGKNGIEVYLTTLDTYLKSLKTFMNKNDDLQRFVTRTDMWREK